MASAIVLILCVVAVAAAVMYGGPSPGPKQKRLSVTLSAVDEYLEASKRLTSAHFECRERYPLPSGADLHAMYCQYTPRNRALLGVWAEMLNLRLTGSYDERVRTLKDFIEGRGGDDAWRPWKPMRDAGGVFARAHEDAMAAENLERLLRVLDDSVQSDRHAEELKEAGDAVAQEQDG